MYVFALCTDREGIHYLLHSLKDGDLDRGGGTKKKVGGLTLPLNDCTEAGVQGLHSEEFFCPLASEKVVGLSPPTSQSGGAKAPSAPPAPPPLDLEVIPWLLYSVKDGDLEVIPWLLHSVKDGDLEVIPWLLYSVKDGDLEVIPWLLYSVKDGDLEVIPWLLYSVKDGDLEVIPWLLYSVKDGDLEVIP